MASRLAQAAYDAYRDAMGLKRHDLDDLPESLDYERVWEVVGKGAVAHNDKARAAKARASKSTASKPPAKSKA